MSDPTEPTTARDALDEIDDEIDVDAVHADEIGRYANQAVVIGALFIALTTPSVALGLDDVELDQALPAIEVRFDWLKSRYRITVEQIVEPPA